MGRDDEHGSRPSTNVSSRDRRFEPALGGDRNPTLRSVSNEFAATQVCLAKICRLLREVRFDAPKAPPTAPVASGSRRLDNSATMGSHRLPKAAAMIGFEGWLSSNQGGRNACREAIRIEWKSGDANGFRLPCQAGVECGAVENVQCAGVDAGFLP